MSKYIKLEDIKWHSPDESIANPLTEFYVTESDIANLPTIEVSEEVLKATKNFNTYTIVDENAEMGMRTQIEPIIEVSEEQLSKLKTREKSVENTTVSEDFTSISRANSKLEVSEDCISREYVKCINCAENGSYKCSKCDGEMYYKYDKDEPQTYITEDRDTQILDAWQVHHRNTTTVEDAPSVVPSRAEGEWYRQTTDQFDYWECSECGIGVGLDDIKNYCPNCGAKMKG